MLTAYFDGLTISCVGAGVQLRINQVEPADAHGSACARSPGGGGSGVNIDQLINSSSTINFSCSHTRSSEDFLQFSDSF